MVRLAPWSEGVIRPHEASVPATRAAELAAIKATRGHKGAVLAGYRDAATEVDRLFRKAEGETATYETTTADGVVHRVWRIQNAEIFGKLRPLFAPKKLHVLDGHARYEAMLAYQESLGDLAQYSTGNYGLFCLVNLEDQALVVAPRHRIIKKGMTREALFAAAKPYFIVDKLAGAAKDIDKQRAALADTVAHQPTFVVVLHGEPDAWKLTLSPDVSPASEGVVVHRALQTCRHDDRSARGARCRREGGLGGHPDAADDARAGRPRRRARPGAAGLRGRVSAHARGAGHVLDRPERRRVVALDQ